MKLKPNKLYRNGFTVLELLVVIAIIGILSALVMVNVQEARKKGRDAAKNTLVRQYVTAFELAYAKYGSYPVPTVLNIPDPGEGDYEACLGRGNLNGECYAGTPENDELNTLMSEFISGPPASLTRVTINGEDFSGIQFKCPTFDVDAGTCNGIYLEWSLESPSSECSLGTGSIVDDGVVACVYVPPELEE